MSRPRRRRKARAGVARYAAPAAFLLAVTIAVLLIRAGLNGDKTQTTTGPTTTTAPTTSTSSSTSHGTTTRHTQTGAAQYYTVQSGDTFGSISAKTGVPVSQLETLNPGVSSNSLQVGQRVRVK
jgi:LysM repeat protein